MRWLVNALVAIAVLGVLLYLSIPQISSGPPGQVVQTLNNERQIFLATFSMANDGLAKNDPKLGWPGDLAVASAEPITSLAQFVRRLEDYDYLKPSDVGKIFAAPGIRAYTGVGEFTAENSAFKIYRVRDSDLPTVIFSATKNFSFGQGLDPKAVPYGDKTFAIIRKGGDATPYYNKQSALKRELGLMPGHTSKNNPGTETTDSILSM